MKVLKQPFLNTPSLFDARLHPAHRPLANEDSRIRFDVTDTGLSGVAQWRLYIGALMINDIALTALAFFLAGWIRYYVPLPFFHLDARPTIPPVSVLLFVFIPIWIVVYAIQGLYQRRHLLGGLHEYAGVFRGASIGMLVIIILGFVQPGTSPARGWLFLAWGFTTLLVMGGRFTMRRFIYGLRLRGYFLSPALIVGTNAEAQSLAEQLAYWQTSGLGLIGYVSELSDPEDGIFKGLPVLGTLESLDELVDYHQVEEIILTTSALRQEDILAIFKRFGLRSDLNLRLSSGLFEVITTSVEVKEMASVPLLRINQVRLTGVDKLMKTFLDLMLAIGLLIFLAPVFAIIAIAIRLDSPGPVLYRRRVMGLNGRSFDAYKFRTMHTNGDAILASRPDLAEELARNQKLKEDPRVTRVGQFLRRHSLDELPQLFNAIRRDMSIVGPRIITPEETVFYDQWDMNLLTVLPGITGLWQVSGRSDLSYAERVQLDMRYIRNWSIWLDFQILMRTFSVVLKGTGAY